MRVLSTHVEIRDDVVLFSNQPLTGYLYQLADDGFTVKTLRQVLAGETLRETDALVRVCPGDKSPESRAVTDQTFNGVLCKFHDSGALASEADYRDGRSTGDRREWHPNGVLREKKAGDIVWGWTETGGVLQVSKRGSSYIFADTGELQFLELDDPKLIAEADHPLVVDRFLSLTGAGVTDPVLCQIAGLHRVFSLHLISTKVSPLGLRAFTGLKGLVAQDAGLSRSAIRSVQPLCTIHGLRS